MQFPSYGFHHILLHRDLEFWPIDTQIWRVLLCLYLRGATDGQRDSATALKRDEKLAWTYDLAPSNFARRRPLSVLQHVCLTRSNKLILTIAPQTYSVSYSHARSRLAQTTYNPKRGLHRHRRQGGRGFCPPPPLPKIGKYFSGKYGESRAFC